MFVTTGGNQDRPEPGKPIVFATEQGTYIQGMEAAFVSKSGKGAALWVKPQDLPPVTRAVDAMYAKVRNRSSPAFVFSAHLYQLLERHAEGQGADRGPDGAGRRRDRAQLRCRRGRPL